ncbi:MAG: mechanosensitive ion channel family protein [Planctomycetes bacterium]|nr:mechanosensitive ion channel family protein [Planctomycetota bacterium]
MEFRTPFQDSPVAGALGALEAWIAPAGILLGGTLAGFVVKAIVVRRLRVLSARTRTPFDDLLLEALRRHLPIWFLLAALGASVKAAPLSLDQQETAHDLLAASFFLSLTLAASRFSSGALQAFVGRGARPGGSALLAGVLGNLVRVAVLTTGSLLVLASVLGWGKVTPILTALGVGSLAVALALQDTLSNLFAGIHIAASRMVEAGDYIRLDSGQEGRVVDVGWRFTKLREPADNDVFVPNAKVAQAIVVNYEKPSAEVAVPVPMGVAYDSDLEKVERVTLEVAREVQAEAEGAVRGFAPALVFQSFGDSSIGLTVVLRAGTFPGRGKVVHEFVKRLHARYAKEGIEIPFPQRVVHLRDARA